MHIRKSCTPRRQRNCLGRSGLDSSGCWEKGVPPASAARGLFLARWLRETPFRLPIEPVRLYSSAPGERGGRAVGGSVGGAR